MSRFWEAFKRNSERDKAFDQDGIESTGGYRTLHDWNGEVFLPFGKNFFERFDGYVSGPDSNEFLNLAHSVWVRLGGEPNEEFADAVEAAWTSRTSEIERDTGAISTSEGAKSPAPIPDRGGPEPDF